MKILLHICCAPCSIFPVQELTRDPANKILGFYFNPNIHPLAEYINRRKAVEEYAAIGSLEVLFPEYDPGCFFKGIAGGTEKPARCMACWRMRLEQTARFARQNGFEAFTTTLLISPYQEQAAIKAIGQELATAHGVKFYYQDFRPGFRFSQERAREYNLYRQKYCGCEYSIVRLKTENVTL